MGDEQDMGVASDEARAATPDGAEPVPVSGIADIANAINHLRESAVSLKSWFNSVSEQQREAMYGFGHGYGVEQRAADALDCAFRLAAAAIHAMNATASGLETLAQGTSGSAQDPQGLDPKGAGPVGKADAPISQPEPPLQG